MQSRKGSALADVLASAVGHPEFGTTTSRSDGNFGMLVAGGSVVLLCFAHAGYVSVHRAAAPAWRGSQHLDDIVLTPLAAASTHIDTSGGATSFQIARGTLETDRDGARQATLLFPPNIEAQAQSTGGAVAQTALNVHVTELSVGPGGSRALPGALPGSSAFLYAANVVADEALTGAIDLSQPVPLYVENFLSLPVGTVLPAGAYDLQAGRFAPAGNGIVLAVLSVQGGSAALDSNGDGAADSASTLAALGISDAERATLAGLYSVGQKLMRIPLSKLGSWDVSPAPGAIANAGPPPRTNIPITGTPRHVADVDVPVAGTEFSLHYSSDRVLGFGALRHLDIDLGTPTGLPSQPHHLRMSIMPSTGGVQSYRWLVPGVSAPASDFRSDSLPSNRVLGWDWSGLDLAGRAVQGAYSVEVTTSYEYVCGYRAADGFGQYATGAPLPLTAASGASGSADAGLTGVDRGTCLMPQRQTFRVEQWDQRGVGLGGFSLSAHHVSLPDGSVLFGDGRRSTSKLMPVSRTLADPLAQQQPPFNAVPLDQAAIWATGAIRAGGDGSLYIAGTGPYLHRVGPDGLVTTIAGGDPSGCATRTIVAGTAALAASSPVCGFNDLAIMPDGDVVATDQGRIVRIDAATGTIAQLNQGAGAFTPDGALIANATLETPSAIASDATGRIFFSDCGSHPLVRMIDESGHVSTVAGSGASGSPQARTKVDARSIALSCVPAGALEVEERGNVFFAVEGGNRSVLQVDSAGQVVMLGGYDDCLSPGCSGHPSGLELDRKGNIYVAQRGEASVFRYTPGDTRSWNFGAQDESYERVYGNLGELTDPRCNRPAGTPATTFFAGTHSDATLGIAVSSDGSLYLADSCQVFTSVGHENAGGNVGYVRTRRLDPAAETFVASPDGAQYYVFDGRGRHLETRDASTNGVVYSVNYDSAGRLASIVDSDGNTTAIQRDGSGAPTAIVAPFGQQTTLHTNANGYLDSVRPDPSNPAYAMQYVDARGLLQSVTTPRGTATRYGYDTLGVLASTTDAVDVTRTLSQSMGASTRTSSATGPSGTVTVAQARGDDGRETSVVTRTDRSATNVSTRNQQQTVVLSDGTTIDQTSAEDVRWGAAVPIASTIVSLPSGLQRVAATYRTAATLSTPNDPSSTGIVQQQQVVNGATWSTTVDLVARTRTTVSPEGRVTRITKDAAGRTIRVERSGRTPIETAYDSRGRTSSVSRSDANATRSTTYGYSSASGYLESIADGVGEDHYVADALGRDVQWTRADGQVTSIDHDPNGNVIAITPPDKPAHTMSYTPNDALAQYAPPAVLQGQTGSTVWEYTADKQLKRVSLPDGRFVANTYRTDGKLESVTTPLGTNSYAYSAATGGLNLITDPTGGTLSFGSDGQLPNMEVWGGSGHVRGWVSRTYDASFRLATLGVNGATVAQFIRDRDGLTTSTGPMQVARDAQTGEVSATTLGGTSTEEQTSGVGEFLSHTASYEGAALYSEEVLARDAVGRITLRREIVSGTSTEYGYAYDAAGALSDVRVNGSLARHYDYDANGNRTLISGSAAMSCSYDPQDRLVACGAEQYDYNAVGQLARVSHGSTATSTSYDYDVLGNLRGVTLPDGRTVEYEIDAYNRRIGKRVNGARQWGLLYQSQLAPVAQVDAHNAAVTTFIYATHDHVPDYMVKNGRAYRFVVDHLGSVRQIVNVATGAVEQLIEYDEFGNVLTDSAPGFQPFGFSGGLYDADTGLVRFGARDYEAITGRWTAKDPILFEGGQENLYQYVGGDPLNKSDANGLGPEVVCLIPGLCPAVAAAAGEAAEALWAICTALAVNEALDKKKKGYSCEAKCQANGAPGGAYYVTGTSTKNCGDATRNAKANVPLGEYPRHCSCEDTDGFRAVGHFCEAHTR